MQLPNPHFNGELYEQAPGEWYMTLRIDVLNNYWTSMPVRLDATDHDAAMAEVHDKMVKLWNLMDIPIRKEPKPDGLECTRCGELWEDHASVTDHEFKDMYLKTWPRQ